MLSAVPRVCYLQLLFSFPPFPAISFPPLTFSHASPSSS
jgi:hypothetical protein